MSVIWSGDIDSEAWELALTAFQEQGVLLDVSLDFPVISERARKIKASLLKERGL